MTETIRWKSVKTRKPHWCFGCQQNYPPGSLMVSAAYADGGMVCDYYWCSTCAEYMDRHFRYGDTTGQGEIYANDREGWEAIRAEQEVKQ